MNKTFCDICKQETQDNYKYIFPYWNTYEVRGGKGHAVLMKVEKIDDTELDVCETCRANFATIIKTLEVKE